MNKFIILLIFSLIFTQSCGFYKPSDARKVSPNPDERIKKNMEEGRGFRLSNLGKKGGDFLFASSNPMWRATMQKLSFAPLGVVDYGGGIIVTDWFSEEGNNEEIKIAVRFLTNEIRSDAIEVIIHKRICKDINNCKITKIENTTNSQIKFAILKQAAMIEKQDLVKFKKETGEYKIPGKNF
tara:strand:+ start:208 stop:753 length:546 start_codon:yes stop_codon:yes gene_type:complete